MTLLSCCTSVARSLSYSDPYVPKLAQAGIELESVALGDALARGLDCALITTNHECFDYDAIGRRWLSIRAMR